MIMRNRLTNSISSCNLLSNNQHGLGENRSTYMVIPNMVDQVSNEIDNTNYSLGIFDLSKVFDILDHTGFANDFF